MKGAMLIIKDSTAKVRLKNTYLVIEVDGSEQYIGLKRVDKLYINHLVSMDIKDAFKIHSMGIPLYFIDARGYILGKISSEV